MIRLLYYLKHWKKNVFVNFTKVPKLVFMFAWYHAS